VAIKGWPIGLVAISSNFGPALTTRTSPSSLGRYSLPSATTGEALKPLVTPLSRCS
jgi:hypothetical protein